LESKWKQKGQEGQKKQKGLFAFFALLALFASFLTLFNLRLVRQLRRSKSAFHFAFDFSRIPFTSPAIIIPFKKERNPLGHC